LIALRAQVQEETERVKKEEVDSGEHRVIGETLLQAIESFDAKIADARQKGDIQTLRRIEETLRTFEETAASIN